MSTHLRFTIDVLSSDLILLTTEDNYCGYLTREMTRYDSANHLLEALESRMPYQEKIKAVRKIRAPN